MVIDFTTDLTWQQSGSGYYMNYERAQVYIDSLNSVGFASYKDWRLPTLEQGMSLMEPEQKNDMYIDTVFAKNQRWWIWTADKYDASLVWVADFNYGSCGSTPDIDNNYVRAVR